MKDYPRKTYTGEYGPYDYYVVPKAEYSYELICELNEIPVALSEWMDFYMSRLSRINKERCDTINVPIITKKEMFDFGL